MAYNHPDGTPIERLMSYMNEHRTARKRDLAKVLAMSRSTLEGTIADAVTMGLVTTEMRGRILHVDITKKIGQASHTVTRTKLIREAQAVLAEAVARIDALMKLEDR